MKKTMYLKDGDSLTITNEGWPKPIVLNHGKERTEIAVEHLYCYTREPKCHRKGCRICRAANG